MSADQEAKHTNEEENFVPLIDEEKKDKKKKKKNESTLPKCKVFVVGLPRDWDVDKTEEYFGEIGPVRRAIVIRDKDGKSEGYGFVSYALASDAAAAIQQLNGKKPEGGTKPFRMELAKPLPEDRRGPKKRLEQEASSSKSSSSSSSPSKPKSKFDSKKQAPAKRSFDRDTLTKTVQLEGIPETITRKRLQRHAAKSGGVLELHYPMKNSLFQLEGKPSLVVHTAQIVYATTEAAEAARDYFQNRNLSKKKHPECKAVSQILSDGRRCRLIVRNIPFGVTEQDLRAHFQSAGELVDASIPLKPDGMQRGFAFVQFSRFVESEKAVHQFNGQPWKNRPIAVDFCLPKDKYEQVASKLPMPVLPAKPVSIESESSTSSSAASSSSKDLVNDDADEDNDEEDNDAEEEEEDLQDDDHEEEEKERQKPAARRRPQDVPGACLFIRNISFDSSEQDIREAFSEYARVKRVLFVRDRVTGLPRGNAFVHFYSKEDADGVMKQVVSTAEAESKRKKNRTLLPVEAGTSSIVVDGRNLIVLPAVTREEVPQLTQQREEKNADPRNLYLAREGYIDDKSPAAFGMSDIDKKRREEAFAEKRKRLQNTNLFVSKLRLCIRNLPKNMEEKQLKQEVLENTRKALISMGKRSKEVRKTVRIPQVKIPRDKDVLTDESEVKTGGKHRGFAFVEFAEHEHALACLRYMNNNPNIWTDKARPIVDFAVVDHLAIQKLERVRQKLEASNKLHQVPPEERPKPAGKKLTRWQKRKLRKEREAQGLPAEEKPKEEEKRPEKRRRKEKAKKPAPEPKQHVKEEDDISDLETEVLEFDDHASLSNRIKPIAKRPRTQAERKTRLEDEINSLRQRLFAEDRGASSSVFY